MIIGYYFYLITYNIETEMTKMDNTKNKILLE